VFLPIKNLGETRTYSSFRCPTTTHLPLLHANDKRQLSKSQLLTSVSLNPLLSVSFADTSQIGYYDTSLYQHPSTMKFVLLLSSLVSLSSAFAPTSVGRTNGVAIKMADTETVFDQEQYIAESKEMRLKHLEEQSMFALKIACENYGEYDSSISIVTTIAIEKEADRSNTRLACRRDDGNIGKLTQLSLSPTNVCSHTLHLYSLIQEMPSFPTP